MKTGTIFLMILIVYASAIPIHYSSSEQELTRFEREIKGSDELTETPETDVDRRKREADEHKEHEGEGMEGPPQIDVRDKRRIKQPTGPATTTAITIAEHHQTLTEEKRSAEHERQENHEMKGGPSEQETEDHHVKKRSDSSNEEEEITNHSIGDCEERIDAETDSQNISEPTIEETQTQEDSLPPEESLLEIEPGRGLEAVVRVRKATHGKHNQPRVMQKNKSNTMVGDTGTNNESPQQPITIE